MKKTLHALPLSLALSAALAVGTIALSPAVALADGPQTNGILVTLQAPSPSGAPLLAQADSALDAAGVEVTGIVSSEDGTVTVEVQPAPGQTDEQALAAVRSVPCVESAQLNYVYELIDAVEETAGAPAAAPLAAPSDGIASLASISVNDPFAQVSDPDESPNQYWLYASGLAEAWDSLPAGAQSNPVTVVTLDSGAQLDPEDLADNLVAEHAYDSANEHPLSQNASTDAYGHGTAVAGVIAAVTNNGIGVAGSTRNAAQVLPIKVIYDSGDFAGKADSASLVRAYDYVLGLIEDGELRNVRVFNLSLGAYGQSFDSDGALRAVIREARNDHGILSVCSGGNGDSRSKPYTDPVYPGDYDECVSVTALEQDGTNIPWSDYNQYKDISAPGASVWSTYTRYSTEADGNYVALSGTSLSAPMVSGAAAVLLSANPDASVDDVLEALYATAAPVNDPDNDRTQTSGSHGALSAGNAAEHLAWHVENPVSFVDVTSDSWFYDAVTHAVANKIMSGYDNGSGAFGVGDQIQRQDVALILYRHLGNGETAPSCGLVDVPQDYYTQAVNWCVANGVFTGYEDGSNKFGVGDPLTRQDLMTVIYRISGATAEGVDGSAFDELPDSSLTSPWAIDAAKWALSEGIISGMEQVDGSRLLAPLNNISRAEVAQVMQRAMEKDVL